MDAQDRRCLAFVGKKIADMAARTNKPTHPLGSRGAQGAPVISFDRALKSGAAVPVPQLTYACSELVDSLEQSVLSAMFPASLTNCTWVTQGAFQEQLADLPRTETRRGPDIQPRLMRPDVCRD